VPADVARLGGPADWDCKDVKFSLAYLSADELDSPWRERIEVIPTRLTLDAAQVDATIEGARAGTFAIRAVREYIRGRVARDRR
jgi:NTE family protein